MTEQAQAPAATTLKDKLKKMRVPVADINKFLAYLAGERTKEAGKDKKPVSNNTDDQLYTMFVKFWHLGLVIDGVNVVITGRGMAMVTFHGYKNRVKQIYPNAVFDLQLVREGDTFKFAKESGSVIYSHEFGNPFSNNKIIGAYCVVKIGESEFFEALNEADYSNMREGSKNKGTWDQWESEFWLKSVIKRACKRHFYDAVADIDKLDNDEYGLADSVRASASKKNSIIAAAKGKSDNSTQS